MDVVIVSTDEHNYFQYHLERADTAIDDCDVFGTSGSTSPARSTCSTCTDISFVTTNVSSLDRLRHVKYRNRYTLLMFVVFDFEPCSGVFIK